LAPFNSTDEYKKRGGAGYDANAINEYKDGTPAELKVVTQGGYSVAKTNGMDTHGKTVIQSVKDGANVGVEFSVNTTPNYSTARSYTAETYEKRTLASAGHGQNADGKQFGVVYTVEENGPKPAFDKFKTDKAAGFFNTTVTSDTVIAMKAEDGKYHTDGLGTQVFGQDSQHH